MTVGAVGDQHEQEADRVAGAVVDQIHSPSPEPAGEQQAVQRMGQEEEELQAKPLQRMEDEDELQMSPLTESIQRMEEDEGELQMKPLQRAALGEEELQMKPLVQRVGAEGGEVSADFESELNAALGGGQSLAPDLQAQMGQAMGADFSGVRVHTDGRSDGLNRSVEARAFTTGQDLFFKRGEYQPGSRGGQELIAHELTHVMQQNNVQLRRESVDNQAGILIKGGRLFSPSVQLTRLNEDDPTPANGADPEASEIEWYYGNPYILDDKGEWRRVARETVNNQRGERGESHKIDASHLREGVRKTYKKKETKLFRANDSDKFLKVVFNYGMVVTAFYMSSSDAKRDMGFTDAVWEVQKTKLPSVG